MIEPFDATCIAVAIAAPFLAAVLTIGLPLRVGGAINTITTALALAAVGWLLDGVLAGETLRWPLFELLPGVPIVFRIDALGITFATLAAGLWLLVNVYNLGYIKADKLDHARRYLACFAASIGSALGVALAGNLLTFLLFYELLTLATFPLVVHKQTDHAMAAGRRYLLFALSGGLALTLGAVWAWSLTGTLEFTPGGFMPADTPGPVLVSIFGLLLIGCAVKSAIMPLHSWLPAAMVAPSPVSALLHAVAVVKAGVFGCMRMLGFVFGPESLSGTVGPAVLAGFCATTIVVGSLIAVRQQNLKRRLAYSTIVHLSYIVLGAAMLSPLGATGAMFHMVNHGLCKITLFLCAGAIYATWHFETVDQLRGLARRMPWTTLAFTVASLGLIGMPGLCGFISKVFLVRGAWQAHEIAYMAIMLGGSVFTAAYLLPIVRAAYFDAPAPVEHARGDHAHAADAHGHEDGHAGEAVPSLVLPLLGTAALVAVFGFIPVALNYQHDLAAAMVEAVYGVLP